MVKGSSGSKESGGSHGVKFSYKRKGRELARRTPRESINPKLRQVFCVCPLKDLITGMRLRFQREVAREAEPVICQIKL
jgi:hypothetical protein